MAHERDGGPLRHVLQLGNLRRFDMQDYILIHHGIKGQRWGVMNGPPYPLGASQKSSAEKRLAKISKRKETNSAKGGGLKNTSDEKKERKDFQLTEGQKRALKIGVAAVGTALVAYGAYRVVKANKLDPNVFLDSQLQRKTFEAADFDTQINDDLRKINREGIFGHLFLHGRQVNCTSCSMAYEMRRRGYDVIANKTTAGRSDFEVASFFKGGRTFQTIATATKNEHGWEGPFDYTYRLSETAITNVERQLAAQGEGARGFIHGRFAFGGGHSIAYEVHNGRVHFVDGQIGRQYKDAQDALGTMYSISFLRTDDLALSNRAVETVQNNTLSSLLTELPSKNVPTVAIYTAGAVGYVHKKVKGVRAKQKKREDEDEDEYQNVSRKG